MLASSVGLLMDALLLFATVALLTAVVASFPLIALDLRRDLDERVAADSPEPVPFYNQEHDPEWLDQFRAGA